MNKKTLIIIVSVLSILLALMLFYKAYSDKKNTAANQTRKSIPASTNKTETQPASDQKTAASQQPQLQPLPADDKQAIDIELNNIDQELKSTDNSSTDLSNASLGL